MANILTGCRILCASIMLFLPAFSPAFYLFYLLAGLTDMLDGAVARKTNTVSEFGSKLDTVADTVFAGICLLKLLPKLAIARWLWIWIGAIAVIKAMNIVAGLIVQRKYVAVHSGINKLTGIMLFVLPLILPYMSLNACGMAVCIIATLAAFHEGYWIRAGHAAAYSKRRAIHEAEAVTYDAAKND